MTPTPIILICGAAGSGKDTVASMVSNIAPTISIAQADPMKRFAATVFGFSEEKLWGPSEERNSIQTDLDYSTEKGWLEAERRLRDHSWSFVKEVLPEKDMHRHSSACSDLLKWFWDVRQTHLSRDQKNPTPRYVLQTLGTEWGRSFSPSMWSDVAIATAKKVLAGGFTYDRTSGLSVADERGPEFVVITDGRFRNEVLGVKYINGITFKVFNPVPTNDDASKVAAAGVANHKSESELSGIPRHFFDFVIENDKQLGLLALENKVQRILFSIKNLSFSL